MKHAPIRCLAGLRWLEQRIPLLGGSERCRDHADAMASLGPNLSLTEKRSLLAA